MIVFPNNSEHIKTRQMIKNLEKKTHCQTNDKNIYYEVTKQVHVRRLSSSVKRSKILDIAYPGKRLLLLQSKPYWIQVEYFNESKKETVTGWVSKRYTKRLANEL